jgi:DNA-binding SARP family transcriptional activator/tetratricopeptide (TPR) repeat protein
MIQVGLLGPGQVLVDGVPNAVRGVRRTAVLAALALQPGQLISLGRLVDIVWGEVPPPAAVSTLRSHVSFLRSVLGTPGVLVARSSGYVLDIGDQGTDFQVAERLITRAAGEPDPRGREVVLRDALALWRGRPLGELADLPWFDAQARRLEDLHARARELLTDTQLELGQHAELIPDLELLAREHPHHEPTHRHLMLALYRTGRQSDALAAYQRLRRTLDEDLGLTPSQPLRDLELAILRQEPDLDPPQPPQSLTVAGSPSAAPPGLAAQVEPPRPAPRAEQAGPASHAQHAAPVVPRQLPRPPRPFAGREAELRQLGAPAQDDGVIWVIHGTGGVGKTWLALHWAHRHAAAFPDGQLHVDLHGFGPSAAVQDPADAVRGFLDALGVAAGRIPARFEAQVDLYRSLTADKRLLVVLDNARDTAQVRPLLPGSGTCTVIVTSRARLTGLITADGAQPVSLDLLSISEARAVLAARLGAHRAAADVPALDELVELCARLPLALAIVAARAAIQPDLALAELAAKLRATTTTAGTNLAEFATDDLGDDLRTAFFWSYRTLDPGSARMFQLLGLFPGPDISTATAASLAGVPDHTARALLDQLTRVHLLTRAPLNTDRADDRFGLHDLLHAYAMELAYTRGDPAARHAALRRLLDHYLHTAHAAAMLLYPNRQPIELAPPDPGVRPERPADLVAAQAWFSQAVPALHGLLDLAADARMDTHIWQLAWAFTTHLHRTGRSPQRTLDIHHASLAAASRLGDRTGQAAALRSLGKVSWHLGRHTESAEHFQRAAEIYAELGDPLGQAHTHASLVIVAEATGQPPDMLTHARRALELYRRAENEAFIAFGLSAVGWAYVHLKEYEAALDHCSQALAIARRLDDIETQAITLDTLGCAHTGLGHDEPALDHYRRALDLCTSLGDQYTSAVIHTHLAEHHDRTGRTDIGHTHWLSALNILDEISHSDAAQLRERINHHRNNNDHP